jgi:hypothetical protein
MTHAHRYILESPNGLAVEGKCRCGATGSWPTFGEDARGVGGYIGRAKARKAAKAAKEKAT